MMIFLLSATAIAGVAGLVPARHCGRSSSSPLRAATVPATDLQREILALLEPYGSPALNLPAAVAAEVDARCAELEATARPAPLAMLDGRWRVEYATAPPPSNGALGPVRGAAFQIVDSERRSYVNELTLFDAVTVALRASFEDRGDDELRVTFRDIELSVLGNRVFKKAFPPGVERTWLLSYTDASTRIVRAGVDGGRSVARDVGLIEAGAGEAKDAYLFVLRRADES